MSEQAFLRACDALLDEIEDAIDAAGIDADFRRSGHVLEIAFEDDSRIVVNGQAPLQEIWLAARDGAFHFRWIDGRGWVDSRGGETLATTLSRCVGRAADCVVMLAVGQDRDGSPGRLGRE